MITLQWSHIVMTLIGVFVGVLIRMRMLDRCADRLDDVEMIQRSHMRMFDSRIRRLERNESGYVNDDDEDEPISI